MDKKCEKIEIKWNKINTEMFSTTDIYVHFIFGFCLKQKNFKTKILFSKTCKF